MVSAINSALSGLTAATQRLNVSAQNIANADTTQTQENGKTVNKPYAPLELTQSSTTTGGVKTATQPVTPPSAAVYDPGNAAADANGVTQYPSVDTAKQLVNAKISSYDARGNLNVLKVQKDTFQSLLNILS